MKQRFLLLVSLNLITIICCVPISENESKSLHEMKRSADSGRYYYMLDFDNGSTSVIDGSIKNVNGAQVYTAFGSYTHPTDNGPFYIVRFIADENGYRAMVSLGSSPVERKLDAQQLSMSLEDFRKRFFRRKLIPFR